MNAFLLAGTLKFDKRDDGRVGMKGFGFEAKHGGIYYTVIGGPDQLPEFKKIVLSTVYDRWW